MFGKRFQKELDLINKALQDDNAKKEFIEFVTPFVGDTVRKFLHENNLPILMYDELLPEGWTYFDTALKKYKIRADLMLERKSDLYYFNTYFAWHIRQGMLDYLESKPMR